MIKHINKNKTHTAKITSAIRELRGTMRTHTKPKVTNLGRSSKNKGTIKKRHHFGKGFTTDPFWQLSSISHNFKVKANFLNRYCIRTPGLPNDLGLTRRVFKRAEMMRRIPCASCSANARLAGLIEYPGVQQSLFFDSRSMALQLGQL